NNKPKNKGKVKLDGLLDDHLPSQTALYQKRLETKKTQMKELKSKCKSWIENSTIKGLAQRGRTVNGDVHTLLKHKTKHKCIYFIYVHTHPVFLKKKNKQANFLFSPIGVYS
ncbi:hypothetical protein RFI_21367, partial [Reticulomyxa filosa]